MKTITPEVHSSMMNVRVLSEAQLTKAKKMLKFLKNAPLVTQKQIIAAHHAIANKLYGPYWIIKNLAARPTKAALKLAGATITAARPHGGFYDLGALITSSEAANARKSQKAVKPATKPVAKSKQLVAV